jgi:outer membrane receptor for ferrienterochelin and colicin
MKKGIFAILTVFIIYSSFYAGSVGKLSGKVIDAKTKEPIIGANVFLIGTNFGAATDINGNFMILNIPPGTYDVKVSFIGYQSKTIKLVKINIDQTTYLDLSLESGEIEFEQIVIRAETPQVQKDLTGSVSVVTREQIEALPAAGFMDIIKLQAGVVGEGNRINVRGGRANEVAFLIDGMYVRDPLLGGLAAQINNDAIQEMSLLSGTFNAEYGNALSGVVNIVTRDGGEKFGGKLEYRTSSFGIKEYADLEELRLNGSFSGPLISKDVRFFISGETNQRGSYLPFGYDKDWIGFAKLTFFNIKGFKYSVSGRANLNRRKNYNHAYKYIPQYYSKIESESSQGSFAATHSVASNFFYDIRFSYFDQKYFNGYDRDTSRYIGINDYIYRITIENGKEYRDFYDYATPTSLTDSRTRTVEGKLDAVWQIGNNNEVKFGAQFKHHYLKLFSVDGIKRPIALQYIDNYETNKPYELAFYVQDKIEFPFLVVNAGLRFDYMNANVSFRKDPLDPNSMIKVKPRYQISPRIGISHPISDITKIHFSYGHFFQNPDYRFLFENKDYKTSVREPIFGQPSLDAQRTVAFETGLSHQLNENTAIHAVVYYKDITGLVGTTYLFPFVDGRPIGYTLYVNEDYANVKGFELTVDSRPTEHFGGSLSYTYSVAKGSASSETEQYPGTQESTLLYYLDFDKTHVFNASTSFFLKKDEGPDLFGIKILENTDLSLIFRASSGYPYTPSGRDIGFVVKNSLRLPATYQLDVEFGKEFIIDFIKIRAFVEAYNVTNRKNVLYVYPDTGDPEFTLVGNRSREYMRNPANYGPPRSVRLGVGIKF